MYSKVAPSDADFFVNGYELVGAQGLLVATITIMFGPVAVWSDTRDFSINTLQCKRYRGDSMLLFDNFCGLSLEEYDIARGKGNLLFLGKMIFARKVVIALHFFATLHWILTWVYPQLQIWRVITLYFQQLLAITLLVNLESFMLTDDFDAGVYQDFRTRNVNYAATIFIVSMASFLIGLYTYRYRRYGNIYK
jgi:hypothetical protein